MKTLNQTILTRAHNICPFIEGNVQLYFSANFSKLAKVKIDIDGAAKCLAFCEKEVGARWYKRTIPIHIVVEYANGIIHDYVDDQFDPMDNVLVHRQFRGIVRNLMKCFIEEVNENLPRWKKWYKQEAEAISSAEW